MPIEVCRTRASDPDPVFDWLLLSMPGRTTTLTFLSRIIRYLSKKSVRPPDRRQNQDCKPNCFSLTYHLNQRTMPSATEIVAIFVLAWLVRRIFQFRNLINTYKWVVIISPLLPPRGSPSSHHSIFQGYAHPSRHVLPLHVSLHSRHVLDRGRLICEILFIGSSPCILRLAKLSFPDSYLE